MTVGNELIMGAVPPERAGAAAAVVETATEFGAALGIAVLGSVGVAAYRSSLAVSATPGTPPAALATARDTLGGAVTVAGQLPGRIGTDLLEAARAAFTHGLNNAALGAAIVMVLAAVLSAAFFRGVRVKPPPTSTGEPQAEAEQELAARSATITHVLLREGPVWARKEAAIPFDKVTEFDNGIRLNITKQQVRDLPPVDIDHPAE
jgi:hypothetical protein